MKFNLYTDSCGQLSTEAVVSRSGSAGPPSQVVHNISAAASVSSNASSSQQPSGRRFFSAPDRDPNWSEASASASTSCQIAPSRFASSLSSSRAPVPAMNQVPNLDSVPRHDSIRDWKVWLIKKVNAHLAAQPEPQPSVYFSSPSISLASILLWRYLESALGDGKDVKVFDLPGENIVGKFPLYLLFGGRGELWSVCVTFSFCLVICHLIAIVNSGQGVGTGTKRAVITALLHKTVGDLNLCKAVNAEIYYSLTFPKAQITDSQYLHIRVLAVLCLLYIFTFELAPDPISPALLQFCLSGMDGIIDIDFVRCFAPETANKLSVWPLSHDIPLVIGPNPEGQNLLANLVCEHLDMLVRHHYYLRVSMLLIFLSAYPDFQCNIRATEELH
jgi:hypothetical protein